MDFLSISIFAAYIVGFFLASIDFILFFKGGDEGIFLSLHTQTLLSGVTEMFFARQMHSTSKFDKTSLSMCVCACVRACVCVRHLYRCKTSINIYL